jgi:hypothetical protein
MVKNPKDLLEGQVTGKKIKELNIGFKDGRVDLHTIVLEDDTRLEIWGSDFCPVNFDIYDDRGNKISRD